MTRYLDEEGTAHLINSLPYENGFVFQKSGIMSISNSQSTAGSYIRILQLKYVTPNWIAFPNTGSDTNAKFVVTKNANISDEFVVSKLGQSGCKTTVYTSKSQNGLNYVPDSYIDIQGTWANNLTVSIYVKLDYPITNWNVVQLDGLPPDSYILDTSYNNVVQLGSGALTTIYEQNMTQYGILAGPIKGGSSEEITAISTSDIDSYFNS